MMRIGIFTCNYWPLRNGVVTSINSYVEQFHALGHEAFVFAPRYPNTCESQIEPNVYRFPSLRAPTHHSYALPIPFSSSIRREIARLSLDVVHAQHPFLLGPYALRIARRLKLPILFTYHTRYDRYGHYSPLFPRLASRLALKQSLNFASNVDTVVALTRASAEMLRDCGIRTRIEIIPTGIAPQRPEPDSHRFRSWLGVPGSAGVILFVGRLAREKNLTLLLSAFCLVIRQAPRAMLVIVGEGDDKETLVDVAVGLGLQGRVLFVGDVPHDEVWNYYEMGDIFALPSTSEVQPLAPLEAMASGLPVVAVRYPGIEDYIDHGKNGYITDERPEALARGLLDLLMNSDKRRWFSENARDKAQHFRAETSARKMLSLYEDLRRDRVR